MNNKPVEFCPLCGEMLDFYFKNDYDHLGPLDSGTWVKVKHNCTKPLKRMCINCRFFFNDKCLNTEILKDINLNIEPFEVVDIKVKLKTITDSCKHWELKDSIAHNVFKK